MLFGTHKIVNNQLTVGNVSYSEIGKKFKTPLYVYDQKLIEKCMKEYIEQFKSAMFKTKVLYASKAFSCLAMYELCNKHGLGVDVVSLGELYTALKAKTEPSKIYFHGNNKSIEGLTLAIESQIGCIVLDNEYELENIKKITKRLNKGINIMLRLNPGIDVHTHDYIQTANFTSKFGVSTYNDQKVFSLIKEIDREKLLIFKGVHCHIGSQIFAGNSFSKAAYTMLSFIKKINSETKIKVSELNLGGGFGIYYTEEDDPESTESIVQNLITNVEKYLTDNEIKIDSLVIEPGRSIVGNAGVSLYKIGAKKNTFGGKNYLFVNGGMSDNIRPALYQAKYECAVVNKMKAELEVRTIAGQCCESGDVLINNCQVAKSEIGDYLVVFSTGAYGYSMSSNYNRITKPGVVFVDDGKVKEVIKAQSLEDLIKNDILLGDNL